jgi:amino acid transporter
MPTPYTQVKQLLFGRPLPTERLDHERLNKKTALAVLSSDAISSVAYATEQILLVLAVLNTAALGYVLPISAVIVGLLVLVALSYRQTVFAYPSGGGSYTVAKDNLGAMPGLVAAAALLTDYILTVAVSISGGVAAITSAYASLAPHTVLLCTMSIVVLMVVNLRGVRDSGVVFSVPTYVFIALMLLLIAVGIVKLVGTHVVAVSTAPLRVDPLSAQQHGTAWPAGFAFTFLILRAFSEGCVAMTGTEAISNGVGAFRRPSSKNAATTLGWMAAILAAFFMGTSWLARGFNVMPTTTETVLSQLNRQIFGSGVLYFALQYATFAILVLAANTAFADFPRLSSILANDRYMPRQFAARGDRLAFSNGIVVLAVVAILLTWLFRGNTAALIPLYAIGVFVCFTLSQAGMVVHWTKERSAGWRRRAVLNGFGAAATGIVAIVQVTTKFTHGAWVVVLIIPSIIWLLVTIHRHYVRFADEIKFMGQSPITPLHHTVIVPVSGINKAVAGALVYATTISDEVEAVYVENEIQKTRQLEEQWDAWDIGVPLVVLASPYRSVLRPLVEHVENLRMLSPGELVTVVVPEVVPKNWWEHLLHNKTALYIRTALMFKPNVVVTAVPYLVGHAYRLREWMEHDEELDTVGDVQSSGGRVPAPPSVSAGT